MKIAAFDDDEYIFLEEYHQVISPIASGLKTLSSNKYTFGLYLPTLIGLRVKLNDLKKTNYIYCKPLIVALERGFETRFANLMDIYDYDGKSVPLYIAMVTNPQYKLNFLGMKQIPSHISNKVRTMLLAAGQEILNREKEKEKESAESAADSNIHNTDGGGRVSGLTFFIIFIHNSCGILES